MDDPREFLKEAAAAEEPEVFGHLRAEMTCIRASLPAEGTPLGDVGKVHPLGDVGKVPSAADFLKDKEPDDWLIDQFGMRGSLVVLGGATGASKSTLVYGMAQAISEGSVWGGQLNCKQGKALVIQSDESERNAQRKLQVMDMDPPSFDLLTDMPELDLARLEALQQANGYDAIFMDSITTLLGMCGDGPKMTDVEFGAAIYRLNKWADEANVLVVMTCHLRKQARDATNNNVRIGDMYGAGSQTWAASDVWALWKVEDNDPSYDTHLMLRCLKGRFCEIDTAWHLDGCKEDFSHRVVGVVDPSDLLPLKAVAVKEQALALIVGSGKQWTIKDISQGINCNHEHARRTMQSLWCEHQIARRKLPSTGGRPLYAYTEKDFSYTPNTPPTDR
ncbi:AAA family ATPase [Synechococcus sp. TAK9802]|uniref:AAA family ATPase n=1 Tax=Synechococcus sp. TAK9802 TaxID=1442558 RepID=UPI0016447FDB